MKLQVNLSIIFQGVAILLVGAALIGAYNFTREFTAFQATVITELKNTNQRLSNLEGQYADIQRSK